MEQSTTMPDLRNARKLRKGVVVSDKMDKTRVVLVSWHSKHPRYEKVMKRATRLYAHDEKNDSHMGDQVEIMESRPISKLKRWRVTRVIGRSV